MNLTALIIQLVAGALGGNAAGNVSKEVNLGTLGNTIAGAIGGGVGGQISTPFLDWAVRPLHPAWTSAPSSPPLSPEASVAELLRW